MIDPHPVLTQLIQKLETRARLSEADRAAIRGLPYKVRTLGAAAYIVREGQPPQNCYFLLDGFAYRQKLTQGGEREIVSVMVPGDLIDLQNLFLDESDHDLLTLTSATLCVVPRPEMRALSLLRPAIGHAMWVDTLIEASISREWLLSIGRRPARMRLAHLLCEFGVRLKAQLTDDAEYQLPMTQEQLGDTLGLTPVHVNRVLKSLEADGLIDRNRRRIRVIDWERLRETAEFNERYLHLGQTVIERPLSRDSAADSAAPIPG